MNFKLVSLIFSGITLAGGVTAIAITKNKNSSSQEELDSNAREAGHKEPDAGENNKSPIQGGGEGSSANPGEISHTPPSSKTTLNEGQSLSADSPDSESETLTGVDSNSVDTAKAKK